MLIQRAEGAKREAAAKRQGESKKEKDGVARKVSCPKKRRGKEPRCRINGAQVRTGKAWDRKSGNGKMDAGVRAAMPPTRAEAEPEAEPRSDHAPEGNPRHVPRATGMT